MNRRNGELNGGLSVHLRVQRGQRGVLFVVTAFWLEAGGGGGGGEDGVIL